MTTITEEAPITRRVIPSGARLDVALLTGGIDRPYAYGLAMALVAKNVRLDVIGSDVVDSAEMHSTPNLKFFNLWPPRTAKKSPLAKLLRTLRHYRSLVAYAAKAKPHVFHILWNSKIELLDRTLLMLYYKALGKKVILTAHNVNQARRDSRDSWLNRATLKFQYHFCDHIFVHTQKMKEELLADFGVSGRAVTVIRHPINDAFPNTALTAQEAKRKLGLGNREKVILCFGRIKPYKGIEYLLSAVQKLASQDGSYRLIVAGEVQKGNESYLDSLKQMMPGELDTGQVLLKTEFIPDADMEIYLKAADVLVLPYKDIFQSGVLFLGYSFGLPVVATDVGSFCEEIVEGKTGYLCKPGDSDDLAKTIEIYFGSDLYRNLATQRQQIKNHADTHHSWAAVADLTCAAYAESLGNKGYETSCINSDSGL